MKKVWEDFIPFAQMNFWETLLRAFAQSRGSTAYNGKKIFWFLCGEKDEMVEKRFDRIGCQALKDAKSCSLIVMDGTWTT